jgi:LuxR family transcriptional regulator, maltose regulon positive regulatory protein
MVPLPPPVSGASPSGGGANGDGSGSGGPLSAGQHLVQAQALISESIEHALAAKDTTRAAELVERHAQIEFAADRWYIVERWLAMLPTAIRHSRPKLLLIEACVRNLQHQLVRVPPLIDEAEALLMAGGSVAQPDPAATALIAYLRAFLAHYEGAGERSLRYLEKAVGSLAGTPTWFSCDGELFLALARCMVGRHDQAVASLKAGLKAADASEAYLQSRLIGGLGTTTCHCPRLEAHHGHGPAARRS